MPKVAKVGVMLMSDTSSANGKRETTDAGWPPDNRTSCYQKLLVGLCIGQMVMLIVTAATLGVQVSQNVSHVLLSRRTKS